MLLSKTNGFTLIELMITVAIVGILGAIAYPSYTAYVQKSKRSDALVAVSEAAARQEKYFAMNSKYVAKADPFADKTSISSPEGLYTVTVSVNSSGTSFKVVAKAGSEQKSDSCDEFSLTNTGQKGVKEGTVSDCW